jgi:EmrB/QacA subfamily drug resistance transporter
MPKSAETTGPPGPAGVDRRRIRLVFTGLAMTILLASLDQTIMSTALPTIVGELGGVEQMSWVITAYILSATIAMPVYGRLGDLVGRKNLFLSAIVIFLVGSVVAGSAGSMGWLIAGRFVQGLGGGGLIVTAQAIVADIIPARERGRYMGVLGGVFAVSSVAGPLLGGFFTDVAGWRWCFWINLPVGGAALVVAALVLQPSPGPVRRPRLDYPGMALLAVAVTCLVLFSSWGGTRYPWGSSLIVGLITATVVASVLFVLVERRAAEPVIPLGLFANRSVTLATAAGLLLGVGMFAAVAYLPTFLQMVGGHGAATSGLLMLPMMAALLLSSTVSGLVISATGRYKVFPLVGMAVAALGLVLLSRMDAGTGEVEIMASMAVLGAGIGLSMQVLVLVVQNAVPHALVGTATAANNFFREIGAALGTAVVGAIFAARLAEQFAAQAGGPGGIDTAGIDASSVTPALVQQLPDAVRAPIVNAYAEALAPIFGYLAPLFLAGLVLVALIPATPLSAEIDEPAPGTGGGARTGAPDLAAASATPSPVSTGPDPSTILKPGEDRS